MCALIARHLSHGDRVGRAAQIRLVFDLLAELFRMKNDKDWRKQPTTPDHPGAAEIDRFPKRGFRIISVDVKPTEKRLGQPGPGQPMRSWVREPVKREPLE